MGACMAKEDLVVVNRPKTAPQFKPSNLKSFSDKALLGEHYVKRFNGNLDEIWDRLDVDKNKMFDKEETKKFIAELQLCVNPEMSGTYDPEKFDQLFKEYDDDKNGYLEKCEMCVFIKKVFKQAKKPQNAEAA